MIANKAEYTIGANMLIKLLITLVYTTQLESHYRVLLTVIIVYTTET